MWPPIGSSSRRNGPCRRASSRRAGGRRRPGDGPRRRHLRRRPADASSRPASPPGRSAARQLIDQQLLVTHEQVVTGTPFGPASRSTWSIETGLAHRGSHGRHAMQRPARRNATLAVPGDVAVSRARRRAADANRRRPTPHGAPNTTAAGRWRRRDDGTGGPTRRPAHPSRRRRACPSRSRRGRRPPPATARPDRTCDHSTAHLFVLQHMFISC